jgi:hypothetical protein
MPAGARSRRFVSDYKGRSLPICDETVLAGNDALHSKLHKLVAGALKARRGASLHIGSGLPGNSAL